MVKVVAPANGCKQIDIDGVRYNRDRKGHFDVQPRHVEAMRKGAECFMPTATLASGTRGWFCKKCKWTALINHCPKCGSTNLKREKG